MGDVVALRKQLERSRHQRMLLLQRLNVQERRSQELRMKSSALLGGRSPRSLSTNGASSSTGSRRGSGYILDEGWKADLEHALYTGNTNANIRTIMAMLLTQRDVVLHRLSQATRDECQTLVARIRQSSNSKTITAPRLESEFEDTIRRQTAQDGLPRVTWEFERMEVEEIKRRSGQMDPLLLAEYVDLHSGYGQAMQSSKVMPLMGSDPTVFRNLGFSFAVSPGSTYVFDEPDAPENCLTQQVGGDASSKARIKAATLAKLIEKLSDPASPPDLHQRFALLATFPMVAQAEEILELMIRRCNVPCAPNMTPSELAAYKTARLAPMQIRVLALLKYWLHEFPDDFLRNPNVKAMFEQQMNELSTSPEPWSKTSASNMLETLRRLEASASTPIDESAERFPNAPGDAITSFLDVAEDDFVQAICYEDSRAFVKINAREFVDQAWSKRPESAPNITAMIARFNRMTSFVQATILGQDALARRVVVLKKFIKLSELFRAARNYNAVFAIYASLNANAIYRLKQTWEALPAKVRASFDELKTLFSVDNNSRAFRAEMKTLEPPCVPHLGLVLQDLTFIDDGNPDRHQHNMVNFQKMCIMADRIGWIRDCQRIPYRIDPALYGAALQYIQRTFVLVDVETLWTLSQLVEPRRKQPGA